MKPGSLVVVRRTVRGTDKFIWHPIADEETIYTVREIIPKEEITVGERRDMATFEEGEITCLNQPGIKYGIWLTHLIEIQPPMDVSFLLEDTIKDLV